MGTTISRPPITEEALEIYAGKWVALRVGEVVAAADDHDALAVDERVEPTDILFHVPPASSLFY